MSNTIASVFALQTASKNGSKFDAPKADSFAADCDAAFSKEIFDIAVTVTTGLRLNR
ncbi:MAG: hypothetical protein ACJA09_003288 [Alcanivorax sp.]